MKKNISVTRYEHYSNRIPESFEGYTIAVMSDLHTNEIGEKNSILIDTIYEINPDAIMFPGDMVSSNSRHMGRTLRFINRLSLDYPVFYSCGNHELKLGTSPFTNKIYKAYRQNLRKHGVFYLNNKTVCIEKKSEKIQVTGLNLSRTYYKKFRTMNLNVNTMNKIIGRNEKHVFSILLAHNPEYFETYADWGADIVFSGHIHGGIIVLPYVGGVISPSFKLFPFYDFGKFKSKKSTMYLSRGLGSHTIPVRVFNEPEIMLITLHSGNGGKNNGNTRKT